MAVMNTRPMMFTTPTGTPDAVRATQWPAPGAPAGKFAGRSTRG